MSRTSTSIPTTRITAHSTALVCQDTDLRGDITISEGVIVHPKSTILALDGPIVIGANCIVEELVVIVNRRREIMRIGENNHFMVGCRIESPSIGDFNTFQPRSRASSSVSITHHCTISANSVLLPSPSTSEGQIETLPPYSVVYGSESDRRISNRAGELAEKALRESHIDYLREIIPKYNRLKVV